MSELFRALGALLDPPNPSLARVADALELGPLPSAAEHTEALDFSLYPYASVYLGSEGMIGGEARDRIAGFFRAIRAPIHSEPDHVSLLLASHAALGERDDLSHAQKALFWEHLMSFLPAYASAMQRLGIDFYARWAKLLADALRGEADRLGPADRLSVHFRETPPLAVTDQTTLAELLSGILSPARSGMILVRGDLVRMGRDLGLAARAGERRWVLSAMLSQDAPSVLGWLSREARWWSARHEADLASAVWAERAARAADVLAEQAALADGKETSHARI